MYPFLRLAKDIALSRRKPPLPFEATHIGRFVCLPWDLDMFGELNNGRILTLFDLGRLNLARRTGFGAAVRARRWGMAVAGVSVRYRRRVTLFQRIEMRSRGLGWDARFFYIEQSMWRGRDCTAHMLVRLAVTDKAGIVAPERLAAAMPRPPARPDLPGWVTAWTEAEAHRPWPPMTPPEAARGDREASAA